MSPYKIKSSADFIFALHVFILSPPPVSETGALRKKQERRCRLYSRISRCIIFYEILLQLFRPLTAAHLH